MRAVHVAASGEQPQLSELPTPELTNDSVLIQVKAAGLNPIDNAVASGAMSEMIPHEYPLVLGRDAAGIVRAVGRDVDHVSVGDEVVGTVPFAGPFREGTLAEFAVLPSKYVVTKPASLDFVTAAAIPLAAAAAAAALEATQAQAGQIALVNGATGGVGGYVVQLLVARGVTVVATGTPADADRLARLGVTTVVDYTTGTVVDQVRDAYPDGVDVLVELVANVAGASPLGAVKTGGRVVSTTGHPDEATLATAGLAGSTIMANPVRDILGPLVEQAAAGTLAIDVTTTLPLEQAVEGLSTLASGTARGKIVITLEN